MLPIITPFIQDNPSWFDCISNRTEVLCKDHNTGLVDYMVTLFPRNENLSPFDFVYGMFEDRKMVFSENQDSVVSLSSEMFYGSEPLGTFESDVLNRTFRRLLKSRPTLSGRK